MTRSSEATAPSIRQEMRQHFATEDWLPYPRPLVFAFFANPANLPPLMPGWQHTRIDEITLVPPPPLASSDRDARLTGVPVAGSGTRLLITARAAPGLPLRLPWLALIQDFRWNEGFCDLQVRGPFHYWRHCHSVRDDVREGVAGTVVRDEVEYTMPLWPLSAPAAPVGPLLMQAMFDVRQRRATALVSRFAAGVAPRS